MKEWTYNTKYSLVISNERKTAQLHQTTEIMINDPVPCVYTYSNAYQIKYIAFL